MYSKDARACGVTAYLKLRSFRKTAALLGISRSTLHRWVSSSPLVKRHAQPRKVTEQVLHSILARIADRPFASPAEVAAHVQQQLSVALSASCIRFWMKRRGVTRKKATRLVMRGELDAVRAAFARQETRYIDPERVLSSFFFDMKPAFGYCARGKRLRVPAHPGGRMRWSLLMAVSNQSVGGSSSKGR